MERIQITQVEINESIDLVTNKPIAYSGQDFPITKLTDRLFEILIYQLFKARIERDDINLKSQYDKIFLMQGVGERGRDVSLTKNGRNVGIIQCKQIDKNLSKPEVLKEILKFVLHAIKDSTLISNQKKFTYYLVASKGFAETTINLVANFNKNCFKEPINDYCVELINKYKSLNGLKVDEIKQHIDNILENINVQLLFPSDINQYLNENDSIIKSFFKVYTVTDNTLLDSIIDNYLAPILDNILPKKDTRHKDFTFRFKEYLQRSFGYYSSSRTLVFGNQQKKLEDFYYPLNLECVIDNVKNNKYITSTLKYDENFIPKFKKVLIVDNGGMGKSTIMKWLFLRVIKQRKGIPVFLELRKLKNKRTIIDEILFELKPIDEDIEKELILKLIAKGNFIFFLDGYDEIADEDREFVTTDLQSFISKSGKNLFIMTSRPETALQSFNDFKEFQVQKLTKLEAYELIKKIGGNGEKSINLIKKLEQDNLENVNEFLNSPLLVSLLYKKFEHRENIPLNLQEFYHDVLEALYQDHDLTKGGSFIRNKKTKLTFTDFFQILRELGFLTFRKGEIEYNEAILYKDLTVISKRVSHIKFNVNDFILDITNAVPIFSKEGLHYRWSHKSFQEYFAAEFICRDTKEKQVEILSKMFNSDRIEKYSFIFNLCYDIDYKSFKSAILIPYINQYIHYFDTVFLDDKLPFTTDKTQLEIRKMITFNRAYLVVMEKKEDYIKDVLKFLNISDSDIPSLKSLPNFIDASYRLQSLSFGEFIIIKAVHKNDLLKFLIKKKSPLLKRMSILKNSERIKFLQLFRKVQASPFVVVNNIFNDSMNNNEDLYNYNQILYSMNPNNTSYFLDIKKCRRFIDEYEKEISVENRDYYLSDF